MQDGFSILSPAGYIMDVSVVTPRGGPGTYGGVVVAQQLPGGSVMARGVGQHSLAGPRGYRLTGRRGTMRINCTAGPPGGNQAVAFLGVATTDGSPPTRLLGVALDPNNVPYGIIVDNMGFSVGKSGVMGPPILEGTPIEIQFAWDADHLVYADDQAAFQFNNNVAVWYPDVASWDPFTPTVLYVGTTLSGLGLTEFTGTVGKVQVGGLVTFEVVPGAVVEEEEIHQGNANMPGESTVGADISLVLGGDTTMAGDSTVGADGSVVFDAISTMAGDSSTAMDIDIYDEESSTMAGASSVAAGATVKYGDAPTMAGDSTVGADAEVAYDGVSTMDGDSSVTANATVT